MSFLQKIKYILLLLPLIAAQSCSSDDFVGPDLPSEPEVAGYLQLAVSTSGSSAYSRANPSGGENGDGPEHGIGKENAIYDLSIFVYRDKGKGLDGDYEIVWSRYVDSEILSEEGSLKNYIDGIFNVKIPLKEGEIGNLRLSKDYTLRALVIANADPRLVVNYGTGTIGSLVSLLSYGNPWTGETAAEADHFVMSTAFNGAKHSSQDGLIRAVGSSSQEGTVFSCSVSLERVAARIDFQFTTDNIDDDYRGGLVYKVQGTNHTVRILNVIPLNLMNNPSYLVKHVTTGTGSFDELKTSPNLLVAGDETLSGETPTNYVWTPDFINKPRANYDNTYKNHALVFRTYRDADLADISRLSSDFLNKNAFRFENAGDKDRTLIITYANENTCHNSAQEISSDGGYTYKPSEHLTGLLLRAQYTPDKLYTSGIELTEENSRPCGQFDDFWMFRLMDTETVNEAGNIYFDSRDALDEYIHNNYDDLTLGKHYRIAEYIEGICYYNVWIKHANVDGAHNIPMQYGIVRNNIYRLSVNFHNIGLPPTEIEEPHYDIDFKISVVKWVPGGKDHIQMD